MTFLALDFQCILPPIVGVSTGGNIRVVFSFRFFFIIQEPSYPSRITLESTSYKDGIDPNHDLGDIKILLSHF